MAKVYFSLPDEYDLGKRETIIYFYSNSLPSDKSKVVFTKNMIGFLVHGIKEVWTALGKEIITDKELLMLTAGSTLMSERLEADETFESILIYFSNKTLLDFCVKKGLTIPKEDSSKTMFKLIKDDFLHNYTTSLQLLRKQNNNELEGLKVQEILTYISVKYPQVFHQFIGQALHLENDIKLKQVIERSSHKNLTIEELAFLCNMSLSTFKRRFKENYKISPKQYFTQQKMKQAKLLLSFQKRPSDIYAELGYESLASFSSEFKKFFGFSPRKYQEQIEPLAKVSELSA